MTDGPDNLDILAAFARDGDGWRCLRPVTISTQDGDVPVAAGARFAYGQLNGHLDVAEYLEQLGASFGS